MAFWNRKPIIVLAKVDIVNDLKPLLYVINLYIDNYKFTLELDKSKLVLNDKEILDTTQEILTQTLQTLSDNYIDNVLCLYVDKNFFVEFITNIIVKEMIQIS